MKSGKTFLCNLLNITMKRKMENKEELQDIHHLFIQTKIVSKSKKFYLFFKPKEVVVEEPFEITFILKNVGDVNFPGGVIKKVEIKNITGEVTYYDDSNIEIPEIVKEGKEHTIPLLAHTINSGTAWIELDIESNDNKKIQYYQWDRAQKKFGKMRKGKWTDFFHVASIQEIHQRYTNYILLGLTGVTILLLIVNLVLLLR